jgi:hypothetical protein
MYISLSETKSLTKLVGCCLSRNTNIGIEMRKGYLRVVMVFLTVLFTFTAILGVKFAIKGYTESHGLNYHDTGPIGANSYLVNCMTDIMDIFWDDYDNNSTEIDSTNSNQSSPKPRDQVFTFRRNALNDTDYRH